MKSHGKRRQEDQEFKFILRHEKTRLRKAVSMPFHPSENTKQNETKTVLSYMIQPIAGEFIKVGACPVLHGVQVQNIRRCLGSLILLRRA